MKGASRYFVRAGEVPGHHPVSDTIFRKLKMGV